MLIARVDARRLKWVVVALAAVSFGVPACGSSKSTTRLGPHSSGAKGGDGGATALVAGGAPAAGGGNAGTPGAGGVMPVAGRAGALGGSTSSGGRSSSKAGNPGTSEAGSNDAGAGGNDAGAGGAVPATALDVLLMFDDSESMRWCADGSDVGQVSGGHPVPCAAGPTRWDVVTAAVSKFIADPRAAGLRVALRFFPSDLPVAGCDGYPVTFGAAGMGGMSATTGPNCLASACAVPLVELGELTAEPAPSDVQEASLVAAIQATKPPDGSGTIAQKPTFAALSGAVQWASALQSAHPSERTAIILVTNGAPQGCDTNLPNIEQILAIAYKDSRISTYVIAQPGIGDSDRIPLDALAAAGHTGQALVIDDSGVIPDSLFTSLNALRQP
jgi:hypothetical protein